MAHICAKLSNLVCRSVHRIGEFEQDLSIESIGDVLFEKHAIKQTTVVRMHAQTYCKT
jgi:hypothetical protein